LSSKGQVSLDPPDVQVGIQSGAYEDDVHVGHDDLLVRLHTCHLAREHALPRQHTVDHGEVPGSSDGYPIPHGGQICP
jgi:hypothetical protein